MNKTIRFYLTLKDAPEILELIEGIVGYIDYVYDNEYPLDENGMLINDWSVIKHLREVTETLVEEFIEVKFKEIKNE